MSFSNSAADRMDALRFGGLNGLVSPPRERRLPPPSSENRGFTLTRRFTTDSGRVPTLSGIQGRVEEEGGGYAPSTYHKVQLLEKKKLEYERLREQKRRFEAEMQILDLHQRQEEAELRLMQEDLGRHSASATTNGHQSEPTTPPEYRDTHRESSSGFPTVLSRPNRYSTSSLMNPPSSSSNGLGGGSGLGSGFVNRPGRSASTLTSAQFGMLPSRFTMDENVIMKSAERSRRGSADEDEKEAILRQDPTSTFSSINRSNRYSMPVTKSRNGIQDMLSLDKHNTTRFLFGDDEQQTQDARSSYLQMHETEDRFPVLLRGEHPQKDSSAAALDLASNDQNSRKGGGWSAFARSHRTQQSLPVNGLSSASTQNGLTGTMNGRTTNGFSDPSKIRSPNRYSQDMKFDIHQEPISSPPNGHVPMTPPKLQSSYSANDVPTIKSNGINATPTQKSHDQQRFHDHNASLGRIPQGAINNRASREVTSPEAPPSRESASNGFSSFQSVLQASAPQFAPANTQTAAPTFQPPTAASQSFNPYAAPPAQNYYNANPYAMDVMMMAMQGMQTPNPYQQHAYNAYGGATYGAEMRGGYQTASRDSQARVIQQRRATDSECESPFYPPANAFAYLPVASSTYGGQSAYPPVSGSGHVGLSRSHSSSSNSGHSGKGLPKSNSMQSSSGPPSAYPGISGSGDVGTSRSNSSGSFGNWYQNKANQPGRRRERKLSDTASLAMNRFANTTLESLGGEIYTLCKDQHGCRFLQKQLELRKEDAIHMIWEETNQHVIELMTDPFGNYLCQKLLEYCNDEERTVMIQNASHDLVRIALNQHGTRALQKMIEFISTPEQVQIIIEALRYQVVELIQDLNGNHVIQKCLNKLSATDAQFIFDAVGHHCVDVGTHRHGCCVLQRCIDHARGKQKAWLVRMISNNAFTLVQDPFGNYVVQYILDLNESCFTDPLIEMFNGKISVLSRQKFSSNVIEKCLRVAKEEVRDGMVDEMLSGNELDRLLRDPYANYVVQTAMDYSSLERKQKIIDGIRPVLASIRGTPHGRRLQAKISSMDAVKGASGNASISGSATPEDGERQIPLRTQHGRQQSQSSMYPAMGYAQAAFAPNTPGEGPLRIQPQFPASAHVAKQGLGAHPDLANAYHDVAHPKSGRRENYF